MELKVNSKNKVNSFLENPQKALWELALPMMVGMSVQAIYMLVDTAFIGRWVGSHALAGMGYIFPFLFFLMGITFGLGTGVTSVIANYLGSNQKNRADSCAEHAIFIGIIIYLIMMLILFIAGETLIKIQGANKLATESAMEYFNIIITGSIFMIQGVFFRSILSGEGDSVFPMKVLAFGTIVNIILDPFFIMKYGIKGAAIATIISQASVFITFIYYLIFKDHSYIKFKFRYFKFNKLVLIKILKIGLPASLSMIIMSFGVLLYNFILDSDDAIAAYQTVGRIEHLFFLPIISIATALVTLVGMFLGSDRVDLIKEIIKYGLSRSILISIIFGIIFAIFNKNIISMFTEESNIIILGVEYFNVMIFAYPFITIGMTCSRVMQGLGFGTPTLILTILRVVLINSFLAWIFVIIYGKPVIYAWYSLLISSFITSLVSLAWMGKKIKLISHN